MIRLQLRLFLLLALFVAPCALAQEFWSIGPATPNCGAAGTYNLEQPRMATELADRKLDKILASGAEVLIAGNAGR